MNEDFIADMRAIASDYDAISQGLFEEAATKEKIPHHDPKDRLYSLVRLAERNTVDLRNLTARTIWGNSARFYQEMGAVLGVSVQEEKKWIRITVPAILPGRNRRDNAEFLTRPLRNSLIRFQRENPIERFEQCMICIVHGYDETYSLQRIRDYDNIETKRYLDVIESVMLTTDSGLLCSVLQTTEIMDRDCTQFYLMQPETLPQWAAEHIRTRCIPEHKSPQNQSPPAAPLWLEKTDSPIPESAKNRPSKEASVCRDFYHRYPGQAFPGIGLERSGPPGCF